MEKALWKFIASVYDPRSYDRYLNSSEKGPKISDLYDSGAVFYQLSYQANWELVVMWVDTKPVDDGYVYLIH